MSQRLLHSCIEQSCARQGIELISYSEGWVLELKKSGRKRRIVGAHFDFNNQAAVAIASDKVAASLLFKASGISNVRHHLLKLYGASSPDIELLSSIVDAQPAVIKPLFGNKGEHVTKVQAVTEAVELMQANLDYPWTVSPFIDIDKEIRLVVLDGMVLLAYAKVNPFVIRGLKLFNLNKGATAQSIRLDRAKDEYGELAIAAMESIGLRFGAVDIVIPSNGDKPMVLEINAAFSLARYAKTTAATSSEVAAFYDDIVSKMFMEES